MTISVLVVDDQTLVRAGFRVLLERSEDITVVGEGADGEEAIALVASLRPDVVLMDIRMPVLDGIEATRRIVDDSEARVVVLTTFGDDEYVFDALDAGASGFLLKDAEPEEVRDAVRAAARGDALLAPAVTRRVIEAFVARSAPPGRGRAELERLTDREREVLVLVGRGLDNGDIAERLVISPATAKTHVNRIMTKLGVGTRTQLVVLAYESGLVVPGE